MIISPRANEILDLLRLAGKGKRLVKTGKVYLLRRTGENAHEKILLWDRSDYPPPPPLLPPLPDPPPTETVTSNVVIIEQDGEIFAVPAMNP
ncbi:MAG: hypothetical protein LBI05_06435 [Planctomycetaceae bacterium]|jgi:hypothetical protein|nr:hypothetical protein [Planctomycetaceae bacterium]